MNNILPILYHSLTWQERRQVRIKYIKIQKGMCAYCNEKLTENPPEKITCVKVQWSLFPKNFLKYPIHLHHNHETGMTIGAVHSLCNAVSWQKDRV